MIFRKGFYLSIFTVYCLLFTAFILPARSPAFFSRQKDKILARVGSETVTKEEFLEGIKRLHMSQKAGESLAKQNSFKKVNFRKFLDELIDNKLIIVEAEGMELDKTPDFISRLNPYVLNLFLERLRQEEILDKVKVRDKDIERYYKEVLKKEMPSKIPLGISRSIFNKKVKEREKEYREHLKKKAKIKINKDSLNSLSLEGMDIVNGDVVAHVNGEPITTVSLLYEWRRKSGDEWTKERLLDTLIVRKLLDQEALKRRYDKEKGFKQKIKKKRESLLIDLFRIKVVLPMVKVEEAEIKEYYEANKERFREPDSMWAKLILVYTEEEAKDILRELNAGADFSFLAKNRSKDPFSNKRGGDVGWVSLSNFPEEVRGMFLKVREGEVIGPFLSKKNFSIWHVLKKREGFYKEIDEVKSSIDKIIGRKKFKTILKEYLARLRETVPVEINEEELKKLE